MVRISGSLGQKSASIEKPRTELILFDPKQGHSQFQVFLYVVLARVFTTLLENMSSTFLR